jgi:hypothetical protein
MLNLHTAVSGATQTPLDACIGSTRELATAQFGWVGLEACGSSGGDVPTVTGCCLLAHVHATQV